MFPPNYFGPTANPADPATLAAAVWGDAASYSAGTKGAKADTLTTGAAAGQTGDAFARLGTPANGTVSADVAAAQTAASLAASNAASAVTAAGAALTAANTAATQTTGGAIGAAVLDASTSGHQTAGTIGKAIGSAGTYADPSATLGQIKQQTDKIAANNVSAIGGYVAGQLTIVKGDTYSPTSGKAITFPRPQGATYPADLTGWAVTLTATAKHDNDSLGTRVLSTPLAVINPAGTQDLILQSLSAAQSGALAPGVNEWTFTIAATSGGGEVNTLMSGTMSVVDLSGA